MADVDAGAPFLSGDDAILRLFMNSQRFGEDLLVSWSIKTNSTKYRDDQGGNKVSKVDIRVWGYDLQVKAKVKTTRLFDAALALYKSKQIAGSAPVVVGAFIGIQQRDAGALLKGYQLSPLVFDYDFSMPGMRERLSQGIDAWAESCDPASAPL